MFKDLFPLEALRSKGKRFLALFLITFGLGNKLLNWTLWDYSYSKDYFDRFEYLYMPLTTASQCSIHWGWRLELRSLSNIHYGAFSQKKFYVDVWQVLEYVSEQVLGFHCWLLFHRSCSSDEALTPSGTLIRNENIDNGEMCLLLQLFLQSCTQNPIKHLR